MTCNSIGFKICLFCYIFPSKFYDHIQREKNIYRDVQDPAERNVQTNVLEIFCSKILPTGVSRADDDGLEDTQETNGGNGHAPKNSLKIHKKLIAPIIE